MASYQERIPQMKQPPKKRKSNRKLLVLLLLFFLVILVVVFFRSPYSKVQQINVYGNDLYKQEELIKASGLTLGMQFLNVWESDVREKMSPLKGVKNVTIKRRFPGVIELHISEYKRVAFWTTAGNKRYPLLENGYILETADFRERVVDKPLIRAWTSKELLPELAKALSSIPPAILGQISDIVLSPTPYDKQRITLYMVDGNEVRSVIYLLAKKLVWYPAIVKEIPKGEKGVVYMLESTWFSKYGSQEQAGEKTPSQGTSNQDTPGQEGQSQDEQPQPKKET